MDKSLTTDELEEKLGAHLRAARLGKNATQAEVAQQAGVALGAVRALEAGRGARVATLVRVLRALDRQDWLDLLQPEASISPMQLLKSKTPRQRAGRPRLGSRAAPDQAAKDQK